MATTDVVVGPLEDHDSTPLSEGTTMRIKVVIHPAEEGGFWAEVPALPGCVSEGETFDETLTNIRMAAKG